MTTMTSIVERLILGYPSVTKVAPLASEYAETVRGDRCRLGRYAAADDPHIRRAAAVVLDDERAIVVGEQRDMVRRIDPDRGISEQIGLDPSHHGLRQRVKVAEILRYGPKVERALRIM